MENHHGHWMKLTFGALFSVYHKDNPEYLFEALWSILVGQNCALDEIVGVIEGDLPDNLEKILVHFHQVTWLRIPVNTAKHGFGLPSALNYGISQMKSDVILKVDTDDLNDPRRIERTLQAFTKNKDLVLFGGQVQEWDDHFILCIGQRKVPLSKYDIVKFAAKRNPFNGPTVAFKRQEVLALGGFPDVGANEDYALWAELIMTQGDCVNDPEDLVYMRGGKDLVSRRSTRRYRRGEVEALKAIKASGIWSYRQFLLHYVMKQCIRRFPLGWNRYIYKKLRQTIHATPPPIYAEAQLAWNEAKLLS
jgi:glycosyltransferase involved in cell wall biosynthesis